MNKVGQEIERHLMNMGWDEDDLAFVSGLSVQYISRLMCGRSRIKADTSKVLGAAFSVEQNHFLDVQVSQDMNAAKVECNPIADSEICKRAAWMGVYPIREMVEREWISGKDIDSDMCRHFGVSHPSEVPFSPYAKMTPHGLSE